MQPLKITGFIIMQRNKTHISTVQIESDCAPQSSPWRLIVVSHLTFLYSQLNQKDFVDNLTEPPLQRDRNEGELWYLLFPYQPFPSFKRD